MGREKRAATVAMRANMVSEVIWRLRVVRWRSWCVWESRDCELRSPWSISDVLIPADGGLCVGIPAHPFVSARPRDSELSRASLREMVKKCSPSASETNPVRSDARLGVQSLRGLRFASLQRSNVYRLHQPVASGNPPSKRDLVLAINTPYACLRTLTFYH